MELLLYMGLMSVFILVLLNIFTTTWDVKLDSEGVASVNRDSRYMLSKLVYSIENAELVTTPTYGSTSDTLSLVLGGQSIQFASESGKLVLTENGIGMSLNGKDTNLTNLSFQSVGKPGGKTVVKINYAIESNIDSKADTSRSIDTSVSQR